MAPPPLEAALDDAPGADVEEEEDPEEVEPWVPSDTEPDLPALEPWTPSPKSELEEQQQVAPYPPPPTRADVLPAEKAGEEARPRWPGWPGASVFRLVVPADKVGGLIGRRGETMKRLCDETRARVRVLDATHGAADQIVLVSATEDVEAEISPAMNAAIKIFKHINEIEAINSDGTLSATAHKICSVRLLVPSVQAVHLIGKQGFTIKSIQEITGANIRIIDKDELLNCETVDERIVEIRGAPLKVHNALKSVLGLLRRFLVDHGVLHLFERKNQAVFQAQDTYKENQVIDDYPLPGNQDFLLPDQQSHGSPKCSRLLYGCEPSFCDPYSSDISHKHPIDPLITQITQTMQIPLPYAEEIIGVRGENIEFIRSVSGAVVVLEEIRDYPDEVIVMIKGSPIQVQTAHRLVQEVMSKCRESPSRITYRNIDAGPRLLSSPHAIRAGRDFLPPYHEDQPFSNRGRYPTHHGFRGHWL